MPAIECDAAVILDWLRSGTEVESPKTQRESLRDACGSAIECLSVPLR
jgi:hypothetical protein